MEKTLTFAQQADLLTRAAQKDQEALAQLFEYFSPRWEHWLCTRYSCTPAEAEDRVADLRATYLVIGPPHTHPYRYIARSKTRLRWLVMDARQRERLAPQNSLEAMTEGTDSDSEKLGYLADKRDNIGQMLTQLEVTLALAQLRPIVASALRLYYEEGWDIRTIARALVLPEGTIKSHLSQGRKHLATLLTT